MRDLSDEARRRLGAWLAASQKKITQKQIAAEIGQSQTWVSQYFSDQQDADVDQLDAMARVFGHTLIELLDLRPDPKERELLDAYRAIPAESRPVAVAAVQAMAGRLPLPPPRKRNGG